MCRSQVVTSFVFCNFWAPIQGSPVAQASNGRSPRPAAVGRPVTPSHTACFQQLHNPGHPKNLTRRVTLGVGGPHGGLPFGLQPLALSCSILKGGPQGQARRARKIRNKPNFAQPTRNQWVTSEATGSNTLADRSTAIRGDLDLSLIAQASAAVLPKPAVVGLDTLAILKMGTATTGAALDKREKTKQTQFLVTLLQLVSCSLVLVSGR